ncbi:MAG: ribonuclease III [Chloroflexi bacterium RBG_16_57_9]|nr:MAG: ribonuclease III [Chloroflexi bacterium RBG_16_57_9]
MDDLSELKQRLGIGLTDDTLLEQALTHRSYLNENPDLQLSDNERLEFLGDALLDFIAAEYLFVRFPDLQEGALTSLRAALVQERALANFARNLNLGDFIRLGRGEASSGGRDRPPLLCATFEALVGAILLDQGPDAARQFVLGHIAPAVDRIVEERSDKDAKSHLQEWSQGLWQLTPVYRTVATRGPDHAKEFTVAVLIGDEVYGVGEGRSKQVAEQAAAHAALARARVEEAARAEEAARTEEAVQADVIESGEQVEPIDPNND